MKLKIVTIEFSLPVWVRRATPVAVVALVLGGVAAVASADLRPPFVAGAPVSAEAMNANFSDLDARLRAVESRPTVRSPVATPMTLVSALLDSYAPSAIRSDGDWISGVTKSGTGQVIVTIKPGTFTSAPNCVAMTEQTASGGAFFAVENASATSLLVTIIGRTGTGEERGGISLLCFGPS